MNSSTVPIISVTGTKGKTTTVAVIADILRKLEHNVLKVDTTGHFINGERRSTLDDSKDTWRLVPSVAPGRYMYEFLIQPELKERGVAVLECSLGCSAVSGLGYRYHDIGVFLNVFEDHLGSSSRIQSREDIAMAKSFIFSRASQLGRGVVFNADDPLVVATLDKLRKDYPSNKLIAVGLTLSEINQTEFLEAGGTVITIDSEKNVVLRKQGNEEKLFDLKKIPWTFNGEFSPSVWNILAATGAIYAFFQHSLPDNFKGVMEAVRLDRDGGRLTLLKAKNNTLVLADYAHEKNSLAQVGDLARSLVDDKDAKVIGVVRLAHDRTDELMIDTGRSIASHFDELIVYEKIDGFWRSPVNKGSLRFPQVVGRTSQIFADAIKTVNSKVTRIMREDEAIKYASEIARPNDIVVCIVNDNIEQSIGFIQSAFKADFV